MESVARLGVASTPEISESKPDAEWLHAWSMHGDRARALEAVAKRTLARISATGKGLDLANADLNGLNLSGFILQRDAHALAAQVCDFSNAVMDGIVDATGSLFHGCKLAGAKLRRAVLGGGSFYQCEMGGADLAGSVLTGAMFNENYMARASLQGASMDQAVFTKCWMEQTDMSGAIGSSVIFQTPTQANELSLAGASLPLLRLEGVRGSGINANGLRAPGADAHSCTLDAFSAVRADLRQSRWVDSSASNADFTGASLAETSILRCCFKAAIFLHAAAEKIHVIESTLSSANMTGFSARAAFFRDCDLTEANLEQAYLYRAMFTGDPPRSMSLRKANLRSANLVQAYLAADLEGANLDSVMGAYLRLNQSRLRNASAKGIHLFSASMVKTDMTSAAVEGLEGPVFADRCAGFVDALDDAGEKKLLDFIRNLEHLMRGSRRSST